MISWRVAAELRARGYDVVAVKRDRPELEQRLDQTVLEASAAEQRAVVTNTIRDYRAAHERTLARGERHYGVVYTYDDTLPRTKTAIPLWVSALAQFLEAHPDEGELVNRTYVLP